MDGRELTGVLSAVRLEGGAPVLVLRTGEGEVALGASDLVQGHGAPRTSARPPAPPCEARTLHGSLFRGAVLDGDAAGETLRLDTRCLGRVELKLDFLQLVWFPARAPAVDPEQLLQLGAGAQDETLFQRVAAGLDPIRVIVNRFTAQGVQFEWEKAAKAETFAYDKVAAVAFHGKPTPAVAWLRLLLRDGSRVTGAPTGLADGRLQLRLAEGSEVAVALDDVLALAATGPRHRFVSELTPTAVVETPYLGKPEEFLFRHRRDRSVSGGDLQCGGLAAVRGIGCHSRCALTYDVPAGVRALRTRIGIDDEALALPVPGNVVFRVLVDGKVAAEAADVKGGAPARVLPEVNLLGARSFTLEVDFGGDFHLGDRADWLGACLILGQ